MPPIVSRSFFNKEGDSRMENRLISDIVAENTNVCSRPSELKKLQISG